MDDNVVTAEPDLLEAVEKARRDRRGRMMNRGEEMARLREDARVVSFGFEQFILDHTHEIEPDDWAKLWAACGVLHQLVARNKKR